MLETEIKVFAANKAQFSEALAESEGKAPQSFSWRDFIPLTSLTVIIFLGSLGITWLSGSFTFLAWSSYFAGLFLVISAGIKLLNLRGFVQAFTPQHLLSAYWPQWGYVYPFVLLLLGLAFCLQFLMPIIASLTLILAIVGFVGIFLAWKNRVDIPTNPVIRWFKIPPLLVNVAQNMGMLTVSALVLLFSIFNLNAGATIVSPYSSGYDVKDDQEFVVKVITLQQTALDLSQRIANRSTTTGIKSLAQTITVDYSLQIQQLKGWQHQWFGQTYQASDYQAPLTLPKFDLLSSTEADRAYVQIMLEHHLHITQMAQNIQTKTSHPELKEFAAKLEQTTKNETQTLAQLQQIL